MIFRLLLLLEILYCFEVSAQQEASKYVLYPTDLFHIQDYDYSSKNEQNVLNIDGRQSNKFIINKKFRMNVDEFAYNDTFAKIDALNSNCLFQATNINGCTILDNDLFGIIENHQQLDFKRINSIIAIQKALATKSCKNISINAENNSKWLGHLKDHRCSVILISPSWALTAAHCDISSKIGYESPIYFANYFVNDYKNDPNIPIFNIDDWRVSSQKSCCKKRKLQSDLDDIYVEDKYYLNNQGIIEKANGDRIKHVYDLFLLKLNKPLNIEYLNLPTNFDVTESEIHTHSMGSPYGHPVKIPFEKHSTTVDNCDIEYENTKAKDYIITKEAAICKGDSGGAVTAITNGQIHQIGIISHTCKSTIASKNNICALGNCRSSSNIVRYQKLTKDIVEQICITMGKYNLKESKKLSYCKTF